MKTHSSLCFLPFYLLQIPVKITAVIPPNEGGWLVYSPAGAWRTEEQCEGETCVPSALFSRRGEGGTQSSPPARYGFSATDRRAVKPEGPSNGSLQHAHGGEVREGPERPCDLPKATKRTTCKTRARAISFSFPACFNSSLTNLSATAQVCSPRPPRRW